MFCPSCGQQQVSEETRFCSRCGFLLAGISRLISNNGLATPTPAMRESDRISPRKKGIKQGGQLMILGLIIVPLLVIVSALLNLHPAPIIIASVLTFWGGILRMIYARIFESANPNEVNAEQKTLSFVKKILGKKTNALPPQSVSVSSYAPPAMSNWRDTNDLIQPSVTEETTKLLEKDKYDKR
jgi:hypothetical protein